MDGQKTCENDNYWTRNWLLVSVWMKNDAEYYTWPVHQNIYQNDYRQKSDGSIIYVQNAYLL